MKKLLLDNALEAWAMAISYCKQIMAGKVTLTNRKFFVSSLQNAIELFVKQYMLDACDYRVAEVRNYCPNGEPMREYLLATDLNTFFNDIYSDTIAMEKFYSIEFNKIIEIQKKLFEEFYGQNPQKNIVPALRLLKKLRNDETHFYIDADGFLKDEDFEVLYNLMVDFYEILEFYNLLPFWGEPFDEYERFTFTKVPLRDFSYKKQIMASDYVKNLKQNIEGELFPAGVGEEAYLITRDIVEYCNAYSEDDFDDLWSHIQALLKYQLLEITDTADEIFIDGQKAYGTPNREYNVKIPINTS